ncbi:retrovirus-related pol polyprotein from transposon TNT 1-94 [Tanacetum coccineum]|uniref:Retrovirus-related pol polyprotein from transposon TNT 1-94 n=1 Tax=Tanacetum coccineum TaxID=301880 RepID=A0ABQ5ENC9_9ASTR
MRILWCEDGVDLLIGDHSSNLYTIALNEIASNSSACLLAKASSSQSWLWHQRLSHLNFATINNLVKNNLVRGLPKMKFEKDHLCSACEQGKIHRKHHKSKTAFASNKPLYLLHMDLCGPMRVESINGKRYVLVVVDDYSRNATAKWYLGKEESNLSRSCKNYAYICKLTIVSLAGHATACFYTISFDYSQTCYLLNDYDDVGKLKAKGDIGVFVGYSKESAAFRIYNNEISNNECWHEEEFFHASFESFQEKSSSSSLNDDVQQSSEEVMVPPTNTQLNSNESVPNVNEASTSHNVIEPANVAEALKDVDWVSSMQEELDQFARLKVWRLVPRPKGKTIINTKWIFKNKKDESSFVSKQYPDHVYALDKALYGLKQAPRAWYDYDGRNEILSRAQVNQFSNGIFINQSKYILDILKRFGMENCDTIPTPMVEQAKLKLDLVGKPVDDTDYRSMIRSLMYLTSSLWYPKYFGFDLTAYSDADPAGCYLDRKTESVYVAVFGCYAQVLWMRTQLTDYGFFYEKVPIYCDSQSAIAISCNPVQHTRTKYVDVRYHFIKDHVEKGTIELYFVGTEYQLADLFTKSLPEARFKFLVEKLGMMSRET